MLVKLISHKTKELILRSKKIATNVKVKEDLAPRIKKPFYDINMQRLLNLESVWTIDGQIKFK